MAPFSEAVQSRKVREDADGTFVYAGVVDAEWTIGVVPHGGYILALIVDACIQHQDGSAHPDPLHATAHYLKASRAGAFEARVRRLRVGRGYANLLADFVQDGATRVTVHLIFGRLLPHSQEAAATELHLPPGTSFSRRHPLRSSPATVPRTRPWGIQRFGAYYAQAIDTSIHAGNTADTYNSDVGLQHGKWLELVGDAERLTLPSIAFFADMCSATPSLLPRDAQPAMTSRWYPTLTLTMQWLAPIPRDSDGFARATIGLLSVHSFVSRPDGRHEERVEIWTAPAAIGEACEGEADGAWRDKQVCLCVASQMALTLDGAVNAKVGAKL